MARAARRVRLNGLTLQNLRMRKAVTILIIYLTSE